MSLFGVYTALYFSSAAIMCFGALFVLPLFFFGAGCFAMSILLLLSI